MNDITSRIKLTNSYLHLTNFGVLHNLDYFFHLWTSYEYQTYLQLYYVYLKIFSLFLNHLKTLLGGDIPY